MVTFATFLGRRLPASYSLPIRMDCPTASDGVEGVNVIYVLIFACLWAAVGASVFFVRSDITLRQRLAVTISSAVAFAVIGWIDVSSIVHSVHSDHAAFAKRTDHAG
jgi:hypothetical protein